MAVSAGGGRVRGETIPPDPTLAEQRQLLLDHFRRVVERFGPVKGTILMRCYACCYGQGQQGVRAFRRRITRAVSPEEFRAIVEQDFPSALRRRLVRVALNCSVPGGVMLRFLKRFKRYTFA